MFYNSLKITLRNLLSNKLYTGINIFGLAVGLASVILLGLYVGYELSYDRHYVNADSLYRIGRDVYPSDNSRDTHTALTPVPLAGFLKQDFPQQIAEVARMRDARALLRRDEVAYYEGGVRFVDATFFQLFDFTWLQGDATHAFDSPDSVVLTQSQAERYFASEDALGKTLMMDDKQSLKVSGVIADLPQNTHLTGDVFINMDIFVRMLGSDALNGWEGERVYTFVKVTPGADMQAFAQQLPDFTNRHIGADASKHSAFHIMKVTDIHLHSKLGFELQASGSFATVLTLLTVAAGILLIACFNFMNLATARSLLRGKEVGIRKTIGSARWQLMLQFLSESVGLTLLATLLAISIVEVLLPAFIGFTGKQLVFDPLHDHGLQGALLALVLVVGLVAGAWPAFVLASFKPVLALRNSVGVTIGGALLRNLLVILQFAIAITLVVVTAVVMLQIRYARNYDAGFNRQQVVMLGATAAQGLTTRWPVLKTELLRNPDVLSVSASDAPPGMLNAYSMELMAEGAAQRHKLATKNVDYGFFEIFDIKLLTGRSFSTDFPADVVTQPITQGDMASGNFILNATGARELGWTPESAIGKALDAEVYPGFSIKGRIVGVVGDSNFESVRSSVKATVFMLAPSGFWEGDAPLFEGAAIRISGKHIDETLASIDQAWKRVLPEFPLDRAFLDDYFNALYRDDLRLGQMYSAFAGLAIVIACLGLFGLATFNTQRRLKEIGVRKVMGGSVWSIVLLLTNDFSKLVLIANVLAWPLAYYVMNRWLQSFAYRIDLTPLVFIGSGLIALCIAWVTVGGTAAKAASQKPVLALRYE